MGALLLACVSGHARELPVTRTSRGYCGVTPAESDCAAGSMGAWTETNATGCIQRCFGCARCRFVTVTYRHVWLGQAYHFKTCEWHSACDLDNLMRGHVMDWTPKQKSVYTRGMTWQLR